MDRTPARRRRPETYARDSDDSDGRWATWQGEVERAFPDRFWVLVTGLLVVTLPVLTLLVAYVALTATRSVAIGRLTVTEAVELYLIEVMAFAAFSYLLYRLTLYSARRQAGVGTDGRVERSDTRGTAVERGGGE